MMKRFLFLTVVTICMSSCLKDSYYEGSFTPIITFEQWNPPYAAAEKDSLFFGPTFGYSYFAFANAFVPKDQEVSDTPVEAPEFMGGFGMSRRLVRKTFTGVPAPENTVLLADEEFVEYKNNNLFMTVFQPLADIRPEINSYAVYYNSVSAKMPEHDIYFLQTNGGTWTPKSCMIANTAYTVACATDGVIDLSEFPAPDGLEKYPSFKFNRYRKATDVSEGADGDEGTADKEGDFMRLVAKGYKEDSKTETGKVEIYLVDYIDGQHDSVLTAWKPLDLSKLGDVDYIDFDLEYSEPVAKAVERGEFPVYFCMDDFSSSVHIKY